MPQTFASLKNKCLSGSHILVVDDEPDIVALVYYHLAKAKYRVSTAASGPDALALAKRERPALIVLDVMLPEVDGLEVCKILRRDPVTAAIPILMLTARAAEMGLQAGPWPRDRVPLHQAMT